MAPIRVLVASIVAVLLVLIRSLEPASLVPPGIPPRAKNVLYHLARLNALDRLLLCGFIGVGDGWSQDVFDHTSRESFNEEFDGFWIGKVVTHHSRKSFEVVGVLVDFWPLQFEGLQLCSGSLLALGVLVLVRKLR